MGGVESGLLGFGENIVVHAIGKRLLQDPHRDKLKPNLDWIQDKGVKGRHCELQG